jgi:aspartyl protease family protein
MSRVLPLLALAAALFALFVVPPATPILGLDHGSFARAAFGAALLLWLALAGAHRAGPGGLARAISGVAAWAFLIVGLTGVYAYRFELSDIADRVIAELLPDEPEIGRGGEVILNRRIGGEFVVPAKVDGTPVAFIFDTGASTVVLRAQDAAKVGIDTAGLDFDAPVITANGSAMAAATRIDRISVGPIIVRNVRALVAKPGALSESLLGMSFLERLQSYTVERGRLVLKAK